MAVEDVVTILMEYCEDGEETFRDLHGPEAAVAVQDVVDLLEGELGGQLEYDALWSEFESAPRETAPALSGALEAMIEADPGLGEQMELLLEEYYSTSSPVGPAVGDKMPESEASEFVPREAPRIEEHETEPRGHTDVAGEGTYLYGNVRSADTTVEKAVELSPDVLQVGREEEMLEFDVDELFEQLRVTVGREPALVEGAVEEEHADDADHNGHVRDVPDREELHVGPSDERDHVRDEAPPEAHVNEVDDVPGKVGAVVEQHAVEDPVDDVAEGSAEDERQAPHVRRVAASDLVDVPGHQARGYDREHRHGPGRPEREPEGHPGVFREGEPEPVAHQGDGPGHPVLRSHELQHRRLGGLIDGDDERREPEETHVCGLGVWGAGAWVRRPHAHTPKLRTFLAASPRSRFRCGAPPRGAPSRSGGSPVRRR